MIMVGSAASTTMRRRQPLAVVVTVAKGYDLDYVWKNQGQPGPERSTGGYYINAVQAGEPPGRWWGPGAAALGLATGKVVERKPYNAVYEQIDPRTGEKLGRPRGSYTKYADHLARLKAAEPHATAERLIELERQAAQATRQPAVYTDVTVSFSKSISVLHASIRENARRARLASDERAVAYWAGQEERFQAVLQRANRAALQYAQRWAGVTRTGYHGARVDGQEPGRFEETGLIVTSWLQGTSRDGDPQDHIHNQIARITRTVRDGKWRAHDTASLRAVIGALQAVAATAVECELAREFGVSWVARADGRGNEIDGITQAQMDVYSTRTVAVKQKERELARAWERRHGRAPSSRELLYIAQAATLQSRKHKEPGEIDWDALIERWDATVGGELAGIALAVSNARCPDRKPTTADVNPREGSPGPARSLSRRARARVVREALTLVSQNKPAWTRHELIRQLALVMPAQTRQMPPGAAHTLLLGLADAALSGDIEHVVSLEAPQWPPLPDSLRRDLDGRSVYTRPGTERYATAAQLSAEERLVAHAQTHCAPQLPPRRAARRLGASAAQLEGQLRARAHSAPEHLTRRGLRLDQAAAVYHVLTSGRTVEVIVGPAGTGKTRALAAAAQAWAGPREPGRVFGTANSQNATNELRKAGVQVAANTTRLLFDIDRGRIPAGSLIVVDESSMVSLAHLSAIIGYAARNGCKVVLAGDQEQLAAVEGGGAMMLLADRLGYVQLAEPVRFTAAWERDASLRLRQRDATALDDYDQHGRICGAPPEQAMDQAARAYLASYLTGRNTILMAADWARCRELSDRIRGDLIRLGLVDDTCCVQIAEGATAGPGDLVICRHNDHGIEAGEPGRALANGDILRIEAITGRGVMVRRLLDPDPTTGQRRFTGQAFAYPGYQACDLAYAITGHAAQGTTVHTAITLITGSEDRHWLYPAMTRGTDINLTFVFTTPAKPADPQPGTRPAPELACYDRAQREQHGHLPALGDAGPACPDPREPIAVLADVLERDGSELPASERRRRSLANADHLAILNAQWAAEARSEQDSRYRALVTAALPPGYRQELSPQARWLFRTLRAAELAGLDPGEVVRSAIESRDLAGTRDVASVIDARIRPRVYPLLPQPQGPWSDRLPHLPEPQRHQYLVELAAMMDDRKQRIGRFAADNALPWAVAALGSVPEDSPTRREWQDKAASIGAYRETYGYHHPTDPIGAEPTRDAPDQRAAWHEAFLALGPVDGPDVRGMLDGRLWLLRDTYTDETQWAPRHTGRELRLVRLGARNAELNATLQHAEAQAARKNNDHDRAARHDHSAASYQAMRDHYRNLEDILAKTMDDRHQWEQATQHSRQLAIAADAELRRRLSGQRIEPLRSAEPETIGQSRHEDLVLTSGQDIGEMAGWIKDLATQRQAFRKKIEARQAHTTRSESPDREHLGRAFPSHNPQERDAILQLPKPSITPSAKILELVRERDAAPEATG
jgi:conjugative relaxase-like TrwC/TraI family protein